ncbi:MAG: hypothetical protein KDK53_21580 [Maritimibacter sp.]|nr:hypothetical protein [Maritimibacter sp.]
MTEQTDIRTRADGSIDTAHYMARGREMRSLAVWAVLEKLRPQPRMARRTAAKTPPLPRSLPVAHRPA